ncbi:hypothetical protein ACJJTC_002389 [Scirpophaga incertulas]
MNDLLLHIEVNAVSSVARSPKISESKIGESPHPLRFYVEGSKYLNVSWQPELSFVQISSNPYVGVRARRYYSLSAIITIFLVQATVSLRPCSSANAGWTPFVRDNFLFVSKAYIRVRCRAWSYDIVILVRGGVSVWRRGVDVRGRGRGRGARSEEATASGGAAAAGMAGAS